MCGGRGTRLDSDGEKPLVEIHSLGMVDRVLAALLGSRVETIYPIVSPRTPETRDHVETLSGGTSRIGAATRRRSGAPDDADRHRADATPIEVLDAPGEGYVADLGYALDRLSPPVLTVACDLPLLSSALVDRALDRTENTPGSLAVYVPAALKRQLGVSTDATRTQAGRELAPTGLNVVAGETGENTADEATWVSYDARLAVNVNRPSDLAVAEALCE
jgi:adenosylcobinamide-phosphate guanylyltransferase